MIATGLDVYALRRGSCTDRSVAYGRYGRLTTARNPVVSPPVLNPGVKGCPVVSLETPTRGGGGVPAFRELVSTRSTGPGSSAVTRNTDPPGPEPTWVVSGPWCATGREVKFLAVFAVVGSKTQSRNLGNGSEELCPAGYSDRLREHVAQIQCRKTLPTEVPQYLWPIHHRRAYSFETRPAQRSEQAACANRSTSAAT